MAAELLEEGHGPSGEGEGGGGSGQSRAGASSTELAALQEKFAALLEEATFLKRHAAQLERDNKRLQAASAYTRKSKKQLSNQVCAPWLAHPGCHITVPVAALSDKHCARDSPLG